MSVATRVLRSEYTKVSTTRMWWVLALVLFGYVGISTAGISLVFGFNLGGDGGALPGTPPGGPSFDTSGLPPLVYSFASSIGYVFPLLIGALAVTNEFRHQTLTPTFLASPRRGAVLGGKLANALLFGALYGIVGLVATVGFGALILNAFGIDPALGGPTRGRSSAGRCSPWRCGARSASASGR